MDDEQKFEIIENSSAVMALNESEINSQVATANKYPRSIKKFQNTCLELATMDQEIAASCFYSVPRSGKQIKGESIRMAEIAIHAFGNARAGARVVEVGQSHVTVQATAMDLEKNMAICIEKRARITYKDGGRYNEDMITTTCNAAASKALRDAIFKIIPKALLKTVLDKVRLVARGDASTLVARRDAAIAAFVSKGTTLEKILKRLGRAGIQEINLDDLETLQSIRSAIVDGEMTIQEAFADVQDESTDKTPQNGASKLNAKKAELKSVKGKEGTTVVPIHPVPGQMGKAQLDWDYVIQEGEFKGQTLRSLRDMGELIVEMQMDSASGNDKEMLVLALNELEK